MTARSGAPNLTRPASRSEWGDTGRAYMSRGQPGQAVLGDNEQRWGDSEGLSVSIPLAAVVGPPVFSPFGKQLVDIRVPARGFSISFSVEFLNRQEAGDILEADFAINYGVGSAQVTVHTSIAVFPGSPFPNAFNFIPVFTVGTLNIMARLRVQAPIAGAARTYHGRITAMAVPIIREVM